MVQIWPKQKQNPKPDGFGVLLELLARFGSFAPCGKQIMVLPPSSWRQATVHRTVAFDGSNPAIVQMKKPIQIGWASSFGAASQI